VAEGQDGSLGPSLKPTGLKGKAYMVLKQRNMWLRDKMEVWALV